MKTEIDALMQKNDLTALLASGPAQHNPAMVYLTGGGHITRADLIKKVGQPAVLFHGMMERDEAAKSGLITRDYDSYAWTEIYEAAGRDLTEAYALRYERMLTDLGITAGRVALYGRKEIGADFAIFSALQRRMPGITLTGYPSFDPVLSIAMRTKDEAEAARIRRMGQITTSVVGRAADYLTGQRVKDGVLLDSQDQPVTIGRMKGLINLWLAELGAENPEGTIFAIGRDAAVPHSAGTPTDVITTGRTIVFDIFPCELEGGYYYDFTRTWCLGYAPDDVLAVYEDVRGVYETLTRELRANMPHKLNQERTCDLYEAKNYPTLRSQPGTESGYIHGIGHGIGLNVHERPWSGPTSDAHDTLAPGTTFTIEPGLYFPERGFGVRIEDSYYTRPDGTFELLAPYPYDLVLPVRA